MLDELQLHVMAARRQTSPGSEHEFPLWLNQSKVDPKFKIKSRNQTV